VTPSDNGVAPGSNTTSATLLERLRRPDEHGAWSHFVELYTPLLYHWALRLGCQPHDAADLVQEVFTLLVQKLPEFTYDPQRSFRAWLRTVALNKWRECRRKSSHALVTADATDLAQVAAPDAAEALWEAEYRNRLVGRALELMRSDFQPATWKACWEHAILGRPAAVVAAELGLSANAVYLATSRVLARLRQELSGFLD
jgi:RNA polymerase sigma-70 factor (ECF subfamily)